jgi:pimeloyl-ACP methyl ester carboxylesterase
MSIAGATAKRIALGALEVAYFEAGSGDPLILLHGGLATAAVSWGHAMPRLARSWRVLAPDSRGQGGTNNPADHIGYDQMADDLAAFIAALGLKSPVIVGYSDGAQIGIEFGLRHPGIARAIVLGGVITRPTEVYIDGLKGWGYPAPGEVDYERLESAFGEFFTFIKTAHGRGDPDYWRTLMPQISRLWHTVPAYSDAQLASISAPTLIVTGDRDHLAGLGEATRLLQTLPNSELAVVPAAGHDAVDRPLYWDMVEEFLARRLG